MGIEISRRDLALLLLGLDTEKEGMGGITRLQKLLFLLQEEGKLREIENKYEFTPYLAGPYSPKLYDDLEFLENLGFIETHVSGDTLDPEAVEIDILNFEELMGESAEIESGRSMDGFGASDAYEERRYVITEYGRQKIDKLLENVEYQPTINQIRKIKSKYSKYSLNDLLYYVYTKYPEWATESEIKEEVLRRGR